MLQIPLWSKVPGKSLVLPEDVPSAVSRVGVTHGAGEQSSPQQLVQDARIPLQDARPFAGILAGCTLWNHNGGMGVWESVFLMLDRNPPFYRKLEGLRSC